MQATVKIPGPRYIALNGEGKFLVYREGQYLFSDGSTGTIVQWSMKAEALDWIRKHPTDAATTVRVALRGS